MPRTKCNLLILPIIFFSLCKSAVSEGYGPDNSASQVLQQYAQNNNVQGNYTRADGVPIYDNWNIMTAGLRGPLLIQDNNFLEEMQHFDRERIPERVVHAKGAVFQGQIWKINLSSMPKKSRKTTMECLFDAQALNLNTIGTDIIPSLKPLLSIRQSKTIDADMIFIGAFGYFLSTNDLSEYTQASVLTNVGKKTPVVVRFSRIAGNLGEADTVRDVRGFAIKFYTDQGNWDLVCLNMPFFWIRDSMRISSLVHAIKRNPVTNLYDPVMYWDFMSLLPETLPMLLNVFSDRGIPKSYRTMDGHSGNAFVLTKPDGKVTYVKFNLLTNQGVQNMPPDQASTAAGTDPDIHTRDLYNSIAKEDFPSWNITAELLSPEQVAKMPWNAFDPTKLWPAEFTTTVQMGILVLNQNPSNYFAQIEQVGFDPSRLVPGIEPSEDRILQGRLFSYSDTAMHRLGVNYELLPVNRPIVVVENNERDGGGRYDDNQGGAPNYFPNSFNGPQGSLQYRRAPYPVSGLAQSYNTSTEDNYSVPSLLWEKLTETERNDIATNIVKTLSQTPKFIQERALNNFYQVSSDMGTRLAALLNMSDYVPQSSSG